MSAPPEILRFVEATEKVFAECRTQQSMFILIDGIRKNRDVLRQDHPELDKRIDDAVRACNARLNGKVPA